MPEARDLKTLTRLVQVNANRFFLQPESHLLVTAVSRAKGGDVLAAAVDSSICHELPRTCEALNLRFAGIVPSAVALANLLRNGICMWADGDTLTTIAAEDSQLTSVKREAQDIDGTTNGDCPATATQALGEEAATYADAYAVATLRKLGAMQLGHGLSPRTSKNVSRIRSIVAISACVVGVSAPLTAPLIGARVELTRANNELRILAPRQRAALRYYNDIQYFTRGIEEVSAFTARGIATSALLAQLARALPAGVAIVSLRIDSTGANLVLLGKNAASAVRALEALPGIANPRVSGVVTREIVDAIERERVALQFQTVARPSRRDSANSSSTPSRS